MMRGRLGDVGLFLLPLLLFPRFICLQLVSDFSPIIQEGSPCTLDEMAVDRQMFTPALKPK
jgi:hypothetical protein